MWVDAGIHLFAFLPPSPLLAGTEHSSNEHITPQTHSCTSLHARQINWQKVQLWLRAEANATYISHHLFLFITI
jgi:hypothetical protein